MKRLIIILSLLTFISCNDFLEEKSDLSLATITSENDLQALLDYAVTMNKAYVSAVGEVASDNFFIPTPYFNALSGEVERAIYTWGKVPLSNTYWVSYQRILNVNSVLDNLEKIPMSKNKYNELLGSALFFKAFSYWDLAQVFAPAYNPVNAGSVLGPVVKLTSDVNEPSVRLTLQASYEMMITDLKKSVSLLSVGKQPYPTRPNRISAMALLSRLYLSMNDYHNAALYADSALSIYSDLMNYNVITSTAKYPFEMFNEEVLFFSTHSIGSVTREAILRVDSNFYSAYDQYDIRKNLFFSKQTDGYMAFTGDYSKSNADPKFNGLTTAELWLIKAECEARRDQFKEALASLNWFRKHRYKRDNFLEITFVTKDDLLKEVYAERRKELIMRGVRWDDVRRLESKYLGREKLFRKIGDQLISIAIDDVRSFAYLIPEDVVNNAGFPQN